MRIEFTIPGPPEGKRRPRIRVMMAKGKPMATIYSDPADKDREKLIRELARSAMTGVPVFQGPVRVSIEAVFEPAPSWPKKRKAVALDGAFHTGKPDFDNIAKSAVDALNPEKDQPPFCLVDDGQVAQHVFSKRYGAVAHTRVVVEALEVTGGLL